MSDVKQAHSCGRCDSRWTGSNRAHCAACHSTFGGVTSFDQHRRDGECVHPTELGLDERIGIWLDLSRSVLASADA